MEVIVRCECGQAMRVEQQADPRAVQCPACAKVLTVAGTTTPWQYAYAPPPAPPASGKATAALVLGILSFIPGLGLICAPIAILLGIVVLARKLHGRGFGIAGLACGAAGLLVVQLLVGGYVFMMVMFFRSVAPMMTATAMPPSASIGSAAPVLPMMSDQELAQAAVPSTEAEAGTEDAAAAAASLRAARDLYDRREDDPGNLYRCLEQLERHLASRRTRAFEDRADATVYEVVRTQLIARATAKYRQAEQLMRQGQYSEAQDACEELLRLIPDPSNELHIQALSAGDACRAQQGQPPAVRSIPAVKDRPEAPAPPGPP